MHPARFLLGARKLVAITSKRGNKNFYKGRGAPPAGAHTSRGGYKLDQARIESYTFIAPDLTGFKLLPYVGRRTAPTDRAAALSAYAKLTAQRERKAQGQFEFTQDSLYQYEHGVRPADMPAADDLLEGEEGEDAVDEDTLTVPQMERALREVIETAMPGLTNAEVDELAARAARGEDDPLLAQLNLTEDDLSKADEIEDDEVAEALGDDVDEENLLETIKADAALDESPKYEKVFDPEEERRKAARKELFKPQKKEQKDSKK